MVSNCLGPPPLSLSFNEDTNTLTRGLLCGQQYDSALYKVPRVEASYREQVGSDANWPVLTVWLMPFSQIKRQNRRESTSINCDKGEAISLMVFQFVSRPVTPSPLPPPHIWNMLQVLWILAMGSEYIQHCRIQNCGSKEGCNYGQLKEP